MILFKDRKMQLLGRVIIPKPIVDTLKLKKNNSFDLEFDEEKKEVIIKFK